MAVQDAIARATAIGNGVARIFPFAPVILLAQNDLEVLHVDAAGIEHKYLSDAYVITVSKYPGTGSVTFSIAPPNGRTLVFRRNLPYSQLTRLPTQGTYDPRDVEAALDRITLLAAQAAIAGPDEEEEEEDLEPDDIPDLPASKITSGEFEDDRIPGLPASKIDSGEFDDDRIPDLPTSKIDSGRFNKDRLPSDYGDLFKNARLTDSTLIFTQDDSSEIPVDLSGLDTTVVGGGGGAGITSSRNNWLVSRVVTPEQLGLTGWAIRDCSINGTNAYALITKGNQARLMKLTNDGILSSSGLSNATAGGEYNAMATHGNYVMFGLTGATGSQFVSVHSLTGGGQLRSYSTYSNYPLKALGTGDSTHNIIDIRLEGSDIVLRKIIVDGSGHLTWHGTDHTLGVVADINPVSATVRGDLILVLEETGAALAYNISDFQRNTGKDEHFGGSRFTGIAFHSSSVEYLTTHKAMFRFEEVHDEWTDHTDTPNAIEAGKAVIGNAAGTALVFVDTAPQTGTTGRVGNDRVTQILHQWAADEPAAPTVTWSDDGWQGALGLWRGSEVVIPAGSGVTHWIAVYHAYRPNDAGWVGSSWSVFSVGSGFREEQYSNNALSWHTTKVLNDIWMRIRKSDDTWSTPVLIANINEVAWTPFTTGYLSTYRANTSGSTYNSLPISPTLDLGQFDEIMVEAFFHYWDGPHNLRDRTIISRTLLPEGRINSGIIATFNEGGITGRNWQTARSDWNNDAWTNPDKADLRKAIFRCILDKDDGLSITLGEGLRSSEHVGDISYQRASFYFVLLSAAEGSGASTSIVPRITKIDAWVGPGPASQAYSRLAFRLWGR